MTAVVIAASCTFCYQVQAQGQSLAFFQDVETYDAAVSQAETRASRILETTYTLNNDLSVQVTLAPKDQVEALPGVTGSLMESIPELAHLYTLSVDGVQMGAAADADTITQALNLVKAHYTTTETRSLYIDSQVDIRYQYLPADTPQVTAQELADALLAPSPDLPLHDPGRRHHGVRPRPLLHDRGAVPGTQPRFDPGGRPGHLLQPLDEFPEGEEAQTQDAQPASQAPSGEEAPAKEGEEAIDLTALLGDQGYTPLEKGAEITIEQSCPLLLVTTVEEMNLTRELLPALETQEDATMFTGQQRIIQEGELGQASVLSRVVKRCGVAVSSNDLSSVTLTEATPLIVGTGTQSMPALPDGCLYLWPVRGPSPPTSATGLSSGRTTSTGASTSPLPRAPPSTPPPTAR